MQTIPHNKVLLNRTPPEISNTEQALPHYTWRLLAQLRTNKSPILHEYLHKITPETHPTPNCPLCHTQHQTVPYATHNTKLSPMPHTTPNCPLCHTQHQTVPYATHNHTTPNCPLCHTQPHNTKLSPMPHTTTQHQTVPYATHNHTTPNCPLCHTQPHNTKLSPMPHTTTQHQTVPYATQHQTVPYATHNHTTPNCPLCHSQPHNTKLSPMPLTTTQHQTVLYATHNHMTYLAARGCRRTWAPRHYGTIPGGGGCGGWGLLARWSDQLGWGLEWGWGGGGVSVTLGVDNNMFSIQQTHEHWHCKENGLLHLTLCVRRYSENVP